MKKFEITFPLIWLILLLKPEFRAADYRAMLDKKGMFVHEYYYVHIYFGKKFTISACTTQYEYKIAHRGHSVESVFEI